MNPFQLRTYLDPVSKQETADVFRVKDGAPVRRAIHPDDAEIECRLLNEFATSGTMTADDYFRKREKQLRGARLNRFLVELQREGCRIQRGECQCALGQCQRGLIL